MALNRFPPAVACMILIALISVAIYGNVFTGHRHLPLPASIKTLSILVPTLQLLGVFWIFASAKVNISVVANVGYFLSLLDATLIATAGTYLSQEPMSCVIDETWRRWFMRKDWKSIRGVQDKLRCCGLHSTKDKAWPFPDKGHDIYTCGVEFRRSSPCFQKMLDAGHTAAAIFVVVGVISLVIKISASFYWQVRFPAWAQAGKHQHHHHHRRSQASEARLLPAQEEEETTWEPYTDEDPSASSHRES